MFVICDLKEGDEVAVVGGFRDSIKKVERTTKTQIIVDKKRFRKSDGREVGGSGDKWRATYRIIEPTKQVRQRILRGETISKLGNIKLNTLSTPTLLQIRKLIEEDTNENISSDS